MCQYPPQNVLAVCLRVGVSGEDIYAHYTSKRDGKETHTVECLLPYSRAVAVTLQLFKRQRKALLVQMLRKDGEDGYEPITLDNEVGYTLVFEVFV